MAERPEFIFRDWFVSIGGQLIAPLLDGGQRRAEVDRTSAVVCELFNRYGQTMLTAFREVEDGLAQERFGRERLNHLQEQLKLARQSAERLEEQYILDSDADYLPALTAITAEQRLQREVLSAQLELRLIRVSLYLALAGGFAPAAQFAGTDPFNVQDNVESGVTDELDMTEGSMIQATEVLELDGPNSDQPAISEPELRELLQTMTDE